MPRLSSVAVLGAVCLVLAGCTPGAVKTATPPPTVVGTGPVSVPSTTSATLPSAGAPAPSTPVAESSAVASTVGPSGPASSGSALLCSKAASTPVPCTAEQKVRIVARGENYSVAEGVYREVVAEQLATLRLGGEKADQLFSLTADPLKSQLTENIKEIKQNQNSASGGPTRVVWVAAAPSRESERYPVVLEACEDSTSVQFWQKGKKTGLGARVRAFHFFVYTDGKVLLANQEAVPGSC